MRLRIELKLSNEEAVIEFSKAEMSYYSLLELPLNIFRIFELCSERRLSAGKQHDLISFKLQHFLDYFAWKEAHYWKV